MNKIKKEGYIVVEVIVAIFIVVLSSLLLVITVSNVKLYAKKNEEMQLLYDVGENIVSEDLKKANVEIYRKSELDKKNYIIDYNNIDSNLKKELGENKIYIKKTYTLLFSKYNLYKINYIIEMRDLKIKLNTKTRFIIKN